MPDETETRDEVQPDQRWVHGAGFRRTTIQCSIQRQQIENLDGHRNRKEYENSQQADSGNQRVESLGNHLFSPYSVPISDRKRMSGYASALCNSSFNLSSPAPASAEISNTRIPGRAALDVFVEVFFLPERGAIVALRLNAVRFFFASGRSILLATMRRFFFRISGLYIFNSASSCR